MCDLLNNTEIVPGMTFLSTLDDYHWDCFFVIAVRQDGSNIIVDYISVNLRKGLTVMNHDIWPIVGDLFHEEDEICIKAV